MKKKQIKIYYDKKQILLQNYKPSGIIAEKFSLHYEKISNLRSVFLGFQSSAEQNGIVLWTDKEFKAMKRNFFSLFMIIPAAGGVVRNEKNEILVIFRNGKWDLPKGKIEKGKETFKQAAIREVQEETGLITLNITGKLMTTYHLYFKKERMVLKPTYWFEMFAESSNKLTPGETENISIVAWMRKEDLPEILNNTYNSLIELFTLPQLYQPGI